MTARRWQVWAAVVPVLIGLIALLVLDDDRAPADELRVKVTDSMFLRDSPPPSPWQDPPTPHRAYATTPHTLLVSEAHVSLDGDIVADDDALGEQLSAIARSDRDATVIVKAGVDTQYDRLVQYLDVVQASGIANVSIAGDAP